MGFVTRVVLQILLFTTLFNTKCHGQTCKPNIFCIIKYKDVDFATFIQIFTEAARPTDLLQWPDEQLRGWLARLKAACGPFNTVTGCTKGRWWDCASDQDNMEIIALMNSEAPADDSSALPKNPQELKGYFGGIADLCEPALAVDLERDHDCMRKAFTNRPNSNFREELIAADDANVGTCKLYNCLSAKIYTNTLVHVVSNPCARRSATGKSPQTALNLIHPTLRMNMQTTQNIFCTNTEFPRTIESGSYLEEPTVGIVANMVVNATAPPECSTATTQKPTTTAAPTPAPAPETTLATPAPAPAPTQGRPPAPTAAPIRTPPRIPSRNPPILRPTRRPWRPVQRRTRRPGYGRQFGYAIYQKPLNERGLRFINIDNVVRRNSANAFSPIYTCLIPTSLLIVLSIVLVA